MEINNQDLNKESTLPKIVLKKNIVSKITDPYFQHSVGGNKIKERTLVEMKYDSAFLEITFECLDDPWVGQNSYTKDNSTMFMQEVFELFICKGTKQLEQYLEIEINPNNALFLAKITNKYKSGKPLKIDIIDTKSSGIIHSVIKDTENNKWSGNIKLPLSLLDFPKKVSEDIYRINMYRIILQEKQDNKQWECGPENSTFACWNSTMAEKPSFHVPESFGYMVLE